MDGVHDVAVKVFSAPSSARDMEVLHTEIAVLRSCNSSNIVQFHGVCLKQDNIWVVMELLEQGSLYNSLERSKRRCLWYRRCPSTNSLVVAVTHVFILLHPMAVVSCRWQDACCCLFGQGMSAWFQAQ